MPSPSAHEPQLTEIKIDRSRQDGSIKVLIVDDEENILQLLRSVVDQTVNCRVDCTANAEDAYKVYKKNLHQIIILDIRLGGGMSGIDLLKKIKKHDPVVNIIMITGYGSIDIAVECMKAGAWDFIPKPFSYDHFELVLNRAIENYNLKNAAVERDYYLELSRLDGLTEVYNHRLFQIILASELARAKRYKNKFVLLFMDMDDFKSINDTFGHQKGDELLKHFALTMKNNSRESDFLFRYGGDEFAIILPETEKEGALIYAKRLKDQVEKLEIEGEDIDGNKKKHPVTISIGGALYPHSAISKESIIHTADKALREAKQKNKNRVVFL